MVRPLELLGEGALGAEAFWTGHDVVVAGGGNGTAPVDDLWEVADGPGRDAVANGTFRETRILPFYYEQEVPLEELRLEVSAGRADDVGKPALSLRADEGRASQGDLLVWCEDRDGDGVASAGDRFGLEVEGLFQACKYRPHVYDTWAEDYSIRSEEALAGFTSGCLSDL